MQIGRGLLQPVNVAQDIDMKVDYFRYKDSIADDIHRADLVISHAGIAAAFIIFYSLFFHLCLVFNNTNAVILWLYCMSGFILCRTMKEVWEDLITFYALNRLRLFGHV